MEKNNVAGEHDDAASDLGDDPASAVLGVHRWDPPSAREGAMVMIGRAVLRLRLYRGWSQKDVERSSGVDQTTISRLERGTQRGLSIRRLGRILDALRVGDVAFTPPQPAIPPTPIELMLHGDSWRRAGDLAARRAARPPRARRS